MLEESSRQRIEHDVKLRTQLVIKGIYSKDELLKRDALKALSELFDVSTGSMLFAAEIGKNDDAMRYLIELGTSITRQQREARELAAKTLVNVASTIDGARALVMKKGVPQVLSHFFQLRSNSDSSEVKELISVLTRIVNNLISFTLGLSEVCKYNGAKALVTALATCSDHSAIREEGAAGLGALCLEVDGEDNLLAASAHKVLFAMLIPHGVHIKDFRRTFVKAEEAIPSTKAQVNALQALRNLSISEAGRKAMVRDIPPLIAVLSTFLGSDTPQAVEQASGLIANLMMEPLARKSAQETNMPLLLSRILNAAPFVGEWAAPDYAVAIVMNFAESDNGRRFLVRSGIHFSLVGALCYKNCKISKESLAWALCNLSMLEEGRRALNSETNVYEGALALNESTLLNEKIAALALLRNLSRVQHCRLLHVPDILEVLLTELRTGQDQTCIEHAVSVLRNLCAQGPEGPQKILRLEKTARGLHAHHPDGLFSLLEKLLLSASDVQAESASAALEHLSLVEEGNRALKRSNMASVLASVVLKDRTADLTASSSRALRSIAGEAEAERLIMSKVGLFKVVDQQQSGVPVQIGVQSLASATSSTFTPIIIGASAVHRVNLI